ncbi:mobile mystery protein A [soil metagenome]
MSKITIRLRRRQLDHSLVAFKSISRPARGYVREIREALEMSSRQLAERMGVSQSSVMDLENSECRGTVTINTLEKAASAMGCRVVYALVPEASLEETINQQAHRRARELSETVFRTMALEKQGTSGKEHDELVEELAHELLRKGTRELWKHDKS